MANRILTQIDSVAGCGPLVGCSGGTIGMVPQAREATKDGTPGVAELSVTILRLATEAGIMFQSADNEPGKTTWEAGDWVVRLNVTTVQESINWVAAYVCRFDNACGSLAVVGSLTGQSISLGTSGVKQMTVAGVEQAANLSDEIYIVLLFESISPHVDKIFGFTPDQNIDTPIVLEAPQEFVYSGDILVGILPDEPTALLSKDYAGNIPLSALPSYTSILDRVYGGDVTLIALPDAPVAPLSKSYGGNIGLVLAPNSIYELVEEGATEFVYAGDIPLIAFPSSTRILDRVYQGAAALSILPDYPKALLEKAYAGAVALVLTPNSIYSLEEVLLEFLYSGNIPLSIFPDYSSILDRIYKGDTTVILAPDSLYLLEKQVSMSLRAGKSEFIHIKKTRPFYSKIPHKDT